MDRDELKEGIDRIISRAESNSLAPEWQKSDYTAQILSLLAPELEKARFWDEHVKSLPEIANNIKQLRADAEKWRKVKEMATKSDCSGCKYNHENWCVLDGMCCFSAVVDAFKGEGGKP